MFRVVQMKGTDSDECEQCNADYVQPFDRRNYALRFLWWADDKLHRRHRTGVIQYRLCQYLDRRMDDLEVR